MASVTVVGGGPAGLSAALFAAKNGLDVTIFDTDETWMHKAHLFNYLGIGSIDGSAFMATARQQVDDFGADRQQTAVTDVDATDDGFTVTTDDDSHESDYLVLATGANRDPADDLGCDFDDDDTVDVDLSLETSVQDAYATGAMARAEEWEAVIAAGDGAAAALDILSKEKGERYHDFDTTETAAEIFGDLAE